MDPDRAPMSGKGESSDSGRPPGGGRTSALARRLEADRLADELLGLAGSFFFAAMIWLSAMVAFPVPPFGVPATLQTLAVALAALSLGPRWGSASVVIYLAAIAAGAPAGAERAGGLAVLFGQTAGYLLGFLVCPAVVNAIVRTRDSGGAVKLRAWWALPLGVGAGSGVAFALGVPVLWLVNRVANGPGSITLGEAFHGGCVVFVPWELAKVVAGAVIGWWLVPGSARRGW